MVHGPRHGAADDVVDHVQPVAEHGDRHRMGSRPARPEQDRSAADHEGVHECAPYRRRRGPPPAPATSAGGAPRSTRGGSGAERPPRSRSSRPRAPIPTGRPATHRTCRSGESRSGSDGPDDLVVDADSEVLREGDEAEENRNRASPQSSHDPAPAARQQAQRGKVSSRCRIGKIRRIQVQPSAHNTNHSAGLTWLGGCIAASQFEASVLARHLRDHEQPADDVPWLQGHKKAPTRMNATRLPTRATASTAWAGSASAVEPAYRRDQEADDGDPERGDPIHEAGGRVKSGRPRSVMPRYLTATWRQWPAGQPRPRWPRARSTLLIRPRSTSVAEAGSERLDGALAVVAAGAVEIAGPPTAGRGCGAAGTARRRRGWTPRPRALCPR